MGNGEIVDSMIRDGLWDVYNNVHMGTCGDRCAEKYQFSRQQQDDFAVASFQRVIDAQQKGMFAAEIVPVEVAEPQCHDNRGSGRRARPLQRGETARACNRHSPRRGP